MRTLLLAASIDGVEDVAMAFKEEVNPIVGDMVRAVCGIRSADEPSVEGAKELVADLHKVVEKYKDGFPETELSRFSLDTLFPTALVGAIEMLDTSTRASWGMHDKVLKQATIAPDEIKTQMHESLVNLCETTANQVPSEFAAVDIADVDAVERGIIRKTGAHWKAMRAKGFNRKEAWDATAEYAEGLCREAAEAEEKRMKEEEASEQDD